jgi:hypothetical protein
LDTWALPLFGVTSLLSLFSVASIISSLSMSRQSRTSRPTSVSYWVCSRRVIVEESLSFNSSSCGGRQGSSSLVPSCVCGCPRRACCGTL